MPADPFRSSWEKLDRAERHFQDLWQRIDAFVERMTSEGRLMFSFEQQYRPRSRCIVYTLTEVEPTEVEWGIILGDVLHNLRCALDHMAWQLVRAGTKPPDKLTPRERRAVMFPIYKSRVEFNAAVKPTNPKKRPSCLPGVSRTQIAFIRGLQPYKAGNRRADFHPFSVLQKFSNADKHRILQLAFFRPYDPEFVLGQARDFIPGRSKIPKVIWPEPGSEILRVYGRRTGPDPRLEVRIGSSAEVAIEGRMWLADTYVGSRDIIAQSLYRLAPMVR